MKINKSLPYQSHVHNHLLKSAVKGLPRNRALPRKLSDLHISGDTAVALGAIVAAMVLAAQGAMPGAGDAKTAETSFQRTEIVERPGSANFPEVSYREAGEQQQRELSGWISSTWKTSYIRSRQIVGYAFSAGESTNLDPMLILAIIAKESSFDPNAQHKKGPQGLMQVWRRWHPGHFNEVGVQDGVKPTAKQNILIGSAILREYLNMERSDIVAALQRYNGNKADAKAEYANAVLQLRDRFHFIQQNAAQASHPTRMALR